MTLPSYIAISVLIASAFLSGQRSRSMLSWTQRAARRRSMGVVALTALTCFCADLPVAAIYSFVPFIPLAGAFIIAIEQMRISGSVWTSPRALPFTRGAAIFLAAALALAARSAPSIPGLLVVIAGIRHMLHTRQENIEIYNDFNDLKIKLATLEADLRNTALTSGRVTGEARDKSREAG